MMGKLYKDGYILTTDRNISRIHALSLGFKDIIERNEPDDYSPEKYKIVYEDSVDGIIKKYKLINHMN